jgi:hypothetical protein
MTEKEVEIPEVTVVMPEDEVEVTLRQDARVGVGVRNTRSEVGK